MRKKMKGFSLARKIDVSYRSNLWLIIVTVLVITVAWPLTGSIVSGIGFGGGFFMSWALARELDPVHDLSAFFAGGIYLLGVSVYDGIDFGVLFWVLLLLRLISGICGKTTTNLDMLSVLVLTVYLVYSRQNSLYLFLFTLALIFAYCRYGKDNRFGYSAIMAGVLSIIAMFLWLPGPGILFSFKFPFALLAGFSLLALCTTHLMVLKNDQNLKDDLGVHLKIRWIRLSQLFYTIAALMLLLLEKLTGTTCLLLFAVMAGILAFRLFLELQKKTRKKQNTIKPFGIRCP